jgi:hypothetical protein
MNDPERRTPTVRVMPLELVVRRTTGPVPTEATTTITTTTKDRRPRR